MQRIAARCRMSATTRSRSIPSKKRTAQGAAPPPSKQEAVSKNKKALGRMDMYRVKTWIRNNRITQANAETNEAWGMFKSMYKDFFERGCRHDDAKANKIPTLSKCNQAPFGDESEVYDITTEMFVFTTPAHKILAGFATVVLFEMRVAVDKPFPKSFLYIAHVSNKPTLGKLVHECLREKYSDIPFILELENNCLDLAQKVYVPWGFSPCLALDPLCMWAKFMHFAIQNIKKNPTNVGGTEDPYIYGDIALWMIEPPHTSPNNNNECVIIEDRKAEGMRALQEAEEVSIAGKNVVGLIAEYSKDVLDLISAGVWPHPHRRRRLLTFLVGKEE